MTNFSISDAASVSVSTTRAVTDSLSITEHVSVALTPADQARDWNRRLREIKRRLWALQQPRTGAMSAESIHVVRDELHSFFIECYHLKDALIAEVLPKQRVEDAITGDPALALVADLANLDKHAELTRKPRSGDVPRIGQASSTGGQAGWRIELPIIHKGATRDALAVASEAIASWRRLLARWGLI